jgi:hypothetical protein
MNKGNIEMVIKFFGTSQFSYFEEEGMEDDLGLDIKTQKQDTKKL